MKYLTFFLLLVAACGPDYSRTQIDGVVTGNPQEEVSAQRIVVTQGSIVKAHIVPLKDDGKDMTSHVRSLDENVLTVAPVVTDHDYAFFGLRAGRTTVEIKGDDDVVLLVEAEVLPQPPP